jgi:hypothetical protein
MTGVFQQHQKHKTDSDISQLSGYRRIKGRFGSGKRDLNSPSTAGPQGAPHHGAPTLLIQADKVVGMTTLFTAARNVRFGPKLTSASAPQMSALGAKPT